jgi:periplasmic protein TonB
MTSNEILKADVLDILFENRNKMYGAYTLRKFYNNRLLAALIFSIASVVLLLLFLKPAVSHTATTPSVPGLQLTTIELPKDVFIPKKPEPPAPPKAPAVAQQQFIDQIKITTNNVAAVVPEQAELIQVAISNITESGVPGDALPPISENNNASANQTEYNTTPAPALMQAQPEFPGGTAAWSSFLSRHLQAPDALEGGEKKTVLVRFLVSKDGSVTGFEIVQSGGAAFDNEVIRVLKKMPKWKPAIQNGQHVDVTFTQPVTFMGIEE